MDNGADSMLDVFLFETDDLLEHLDDILLACEKNKAFDQESINEIFRIMHTIKGSSAMMQFNSLTVITHKMEDLFAFVREKGVAKDFIEPLIDLMFRAGDFLKNETEKVRSGQPLTTDIGRLEQEINDFLKKISGAASAAPAAVSAPAVPVSVSSIPSAPADAALAGDLLKEEADRGFPYVMRVFLDEEAQMDNLRAFMLTADIRDAVSSFEYSPKDIDTNPATANVIIRDGFFLFFRSREDLTLSVPAIEHFTYTKSYSDITPPSVTEQSAPKAAAPGAAAAAAAAAPQHAPVRQSLINVNLSKLDSLMDLMGEIVITESMVTSNPALQSAGLDNNFTKASRQLRKLTDELQETVMSIRMVPISTVFQKMNRVVRDMCKNLGKEAKLVLIGEETEVDKTIVDSISDPIMHLVRNSMDHGVESKEERLKAGKSEVGTVTLSAQNTGGDILITVGDDGAGIDCAKVLKKAEKKGMLTKPAEEYTEHEIFQFLLMPGFSTNDVVTEYSGRGVGMDVVKENVEKIGGEVTMDSAPGKGTKTMFKIPLTLAIINGMKISVGNTMFTIPIKNILQSFKASPESIMFDTDQHEIIKVRNKYYPLIRLHNSYGIDTEVTAIADGIVILVGTHDNSYCIFADSLLGEQQVVVKNLPTYLNQFRVRKSGIDGCAILGDGSISLILNVQNLYNN